MKIFTLNNEYSIVCDCKKTRSGFKHIASLMKNSLSVYDTKVCYFNRTWERFEYETILIKTIKSYFKNKNQILENRTFLLKIENIQ